MKLSHAFTRRLHWLNLPTAALIALLQRTPVVRVLIVAEDFVLSSRLGAVLRSSVATAATLGTVHSLAGATALSTSVNSPASATVGTAITIGFSITGTLSSPERWMVGGSVPPGLSFNGGVTTGTINAADLLLSGTPTTAGSYMLTLQATDTPTGQSTQVFDFTINVAGETTAAPAITTQPQSQTVNIGANVTFSVLATGTPAPTYQWRKDGANVTGGTNASLALTNVQATDAGSYTVVVTNSIGAVTSQAATLAVNAPSGNAPGAPDKSGAFASGATEVMLSWLSPVSGGAPSSYKIERATDSGFTAGLTVLDSPGAATSYVDLTAAAGTTYFYRISAVNSAGTSAPAPAVQVNTPAGVGGGRASFVNIATRAFCSTGNNVTIGGFVITGSTPKRVLIRAVGPTLTSQGLTAGEVLADPVVEVHHGSPVIASNDNWGDNANAAEITSVGTQIGANALLASDTASAALLLTLDPGVYSFIVSGKNGSSGVVLLEVYDAEPGNTGATFFNISSRADATTGNGVTIGGFVITGTAPKNVLVRAVGPTLTTQGLGANEVLADPMIELHHGPAIIAVNDDWGTNANPSALVTNGARIGATPIDAADTKSSAMLLRLLPGVYSFIASGKGGTSGIVLVEVYDAD